MKSPANSHAKGFTLIEVMITLGLLAAMASATIIMGVDGISRSVAIGERDAVVTLLETARTEALTNIDGKAHGVHIDATNFTLFTTASTYALRDTTKDRPYARTTGVTVSPSSADIIFTQLSGTTTAITLTFTDIGNSASVDINIEGRIDW
jgi:prepilin-type N-terminal cleavage/methylation domain-containing protein